MECSVCKIRSAIDFCKECERALCEVCGIACDRCGKLVCRPHRDRTPGGRNLCPPCMAHRNEKQAKADAEKAAKGGKQVKSHSFDALMADLDDAPMTHEGPEAPPPGPPPEGFPEDWVPPPDEPVPRKPAPRTQEDELNERLLARSSAQPKPYWWRSLKPGIVSLLLLLFTATFFQPFSSYAVIFFGAVAVLFALAALLNKKVDIKDRKLSVLGFLVGVICIIVALLRVYRWS